jgi:hypothetical protein
MRVVSGYARLQSRSATSIVTVALGVDHRNGSNLTNSNNLDEGFGVQRSVFDIQHYTQFQLFQHSTLPRSVLSDSTWIVLRTPRGLGLKLLASRNASTSCGSVKMRLRADSSKTALVHACSERRASHLISDIVKVSVLSVDVRPQGFCHWHGTTTLG